MQLIVIGSNSSGNAYALKSSTGCILLIEAGCNIKDVKRAIDYDLNNVSGLVCSHSHGDHAFYLRNFLDAGITCFASDETLQVKNLRIHHRAREIMPNARFVSGEYKIKPFAVNHDVPCFGFLISHPEMGTCVFLTDTYYCDYTFPGVNQYIIEANHDVELLAGDKEFLQRRIAQSHMNLDTCRALLAANDLSKVNNIVLIHLSNRNSDAIRFRNDIAASTGKNVFIADKGLVIEFNKQGV